jgi:hypothetical protein
MNLDNLVTLLVGALLLLAIIYGLRFIYDFRIRNGAIEVALFRVLPIYRIPIDDIELIQKVGWRDPVFGFFILRLGNRFTSEAVLLKRRRGWIRRIIISPADPDGFIREMKALQ